MKNRKLLITLAVVAVAVFIILGVRRNQAGGSEKVGAILVLSGPNALWGKNAQAAMSIVTEDVNKAGGINGKPLQIIYEDSAGEAKTAVAAFQKLTQVDRVPAVLGDMQSSTTLAMAPLANNSKTVLVGIGSSSPLVTAAGPFVYRVCPSDIYEGTVFAEYCFRSNYKRVAIFYQNNDYGTGLKNAFKTRLTSLGGVITLEESYDPKDRDFKDAAAKFNAAQPQAIYIVGYYEDTARAVKSFREAGITAKLLGTSSSVNGKLFDVAGRAADGFTAALVDDFDPDALTPEQKKFYDTFKSRTGAVPDWAATHAADALMATVQCLQQGKTTGEAIRQNIDTTKTFHGIDSGLTFDENGDVRDKPIAVKQAQGGKFLTIWKQKI